MNDRVQTLMRQIIAAEAKAITDIPVTDGYQRAVDMIVEHVNRRGGKLVTSGMGKAGQIAMNIATTFCSTGIPVIVITGNADSQLAARADVTLHTGGAPEVCPLGLTPTTSTTMMTVMGDVLVVGVMDAIGFTTAEYAKRHHGGYLGATAKRNAAK